MNNSSITSIDQSQVRILAKNLRFLLNEHKVSESEIAQSLDIPVMTIRRIASGETADPRISTLKLIADYFDISIDSLIGVNNKKSLMTKKIPQIVPILDWKTLGYIESLKGIDLNVWKKWYPIAVGDNYSLSEDAFALESRPSMQPQYPLGTLFIIDPNATASDGDLILIKMKADKDLSLRKLIIDPPRWQLQPIIVGSDQLFFNSNEHTIVGIVILTIFYTKSE